MDNKDNTDEGVEKSTGSKFYALLVQLGIPGVIATAIIGAVYAALVALGVLTLPGCTFSVDVLPDASQHWEGSFALPESATVTPEK